MHEYAITSSIISILEKAAAGKGISKIRKVNFELNPLASVEPDSIKFYFGFLTRESEILKDAKLHFRKLKFKLKCSNCGKIFSSASFPPECPLCGEAGGSGNMLDNISDDIKIISFIAD
jgi:hydrogenase nickel incorporation protein HypA/HybF